MDTGDRITDDERAKAALRKEIRWLLNKVESAFYAGEGVTLTQHDLQRVSDMLRGVQDQSAKALGYE